MFIVEPSYKFVFSCLMGRALDDLFSELNGWRYSAQITQTEKEWNKCKVFWLKKFPNKNLNVLLFYMIQIGEILDDKLCIAFLRIFLFFFDFAQKNLDVNLKFC